MLMMTDGGDEYHGLLSMIESENDHSDFERFIDSCFGIYIDRIIAHIFLPFIVLLNLSVGL